MSDPSRRSAAAAGTRSESPKRKYNTEATTIRDRLPSSLEILVPENNNNSNHPSEEERRFSPSLSETNRCDSPRSNVAARFEALEIHHDADDAPRKRVKTTDPMRGENAAKFEATPEQPRMRFDFGNKEPAATFEIAETPGCRLDVTRSPTSSPLARPAEPSIPTNHVSPIVKVSPKRMRSPPPLLPSTTSSPFSNRPSSLKPTPNLHHQNRQTSPSAPDIRGLTWQDSEITGHEIHRSLGDDGEGINGIGFRPTPAIAQERRQKRKHQLSEWRAREAREARQRRFEKRQGGGGGGGCSVDVNRGVDGGDEGQRRVVRFEEIG